MVTSYEAVAPSIFCLLYIFSNSLFYSIRTFAMQEN